MPEHEQNESNGCEEALIGARQSARLREASLDPAAATRTIRWLLDRHREPLADDPQDVALAAVVPPGGTVLDAVLVVRQELLVWRKDVDDALAVLRAAGIDAGAGREVVRRVQVIDLARGDDADTVVAGVGALRAAGIRASANHVTPANPITMKAVAPPQPAPTPLPTRTERGAGEGVRVHVIDNGIDDALARRQDGWLDGVVGEQDPTASGLDPATELVDGTGHGTAVAGVVRLAAPGVELFVHRALTSDGIGSEVNVAEAILDAHEAGARIINLSLGGPSLHGEAPLALEDALDHIPPDVIVVASAGNEGVDRLTWPAAFKRVVAVAALDDDGSPAPYSNRGHWVDFSIRGTGVTTTYVHGTTSADDVFDGSDPDAVWTGTSFAAPRVAGLLAARIGEGMTASEALTDLREQGRLLEDFGVALRS